MSDGWLTARKSPLGDTLMTLPAEGKSIVATCCLFATLISATRVALDQQHLPAVGREGEPAEVGGRKFDGSDHLVGAVEMICTRFCSCAMTQTSRPSGLTSMPDIAPPSTTVFIAPVVRLIALTLLPSRWGTYSFLPSGVTSTNQPPSAFVLPDLENVAGLHVDFEHSPCGCTRNPENRVVAADANVVRIL